MQQIMAEAITAGTTAVTACSEASPTHFAAADLAVTMHWAAFLITTVLADTALVTDTAVTSDITALTGTGTARLDTMRT